MNELTPRGTKVCRGCGAAGPCPCSTWATSRCRTRWRSRRTTPDPTFPLHLRVCPLCGLGQIGEYVLPERIFGAEYPYLSSVSTSWVAHAGRYAESMRETLSLGADDLVMEIASNDGYLLEQVQAFGIRVLGVEPAHGVADIARAKGVPTVSEFFGLDTAERLVAEHGHPRLVAANNVMAHVPDLQDFMAGLAHLCDDRTVITVENPSFLTLLEEAQFDTIYHEHFSYLTAHAMARVVEQLGLALVRVERLSHARRVEPLLDHAAWGAVRRAERGGDHRGGAVLRPALPRPVGVVRGAQPVGHPTGCGPGSTSGRASGRTVAAYGAAAKGNTLMNAAGVVCDDLVVVVDGSEQKQGKFLPGTQVPVAAPTELAAYDAQDVLILPWNLAHEIAPLVQELSPDRPPGSPYPRCRPSADPT